MHDLLGTRQFPWTLEPGVVVAGAVAAALFAQGFARLRRRGRADLASWDRVCLFAAGLAALVLPLVSPLDPIADRYLLSAHMLEHLLIGDVAPALLLLALRGPLLFFFLPAEILKELAGMRPLRRFLGFVLQPRVSVATWAVVMAVWHVPAAYDYTLTHATVHNLEHVCFFIAGLLVWTQLIDPAGHRRLSRTRRLAVAAALFCMGTVLSDVLIFSFRPLYPSYAFPPSRLLGLSPVRDQQLAGIVMTAEQFIALGACCLFLLLPIVRGQGRPSRRVVREQTA